MVEQLLQVAVLVFAGYRVGWWVGRGQGHAEAMKWHDRIRAGWARRSRRPESASQAALG